MSRQLAAKEEEILKIKNKFREERQGLETDKKRKEKEVLALQTNIEGAHERFYALKKEVEESPLSILRQELAAKNAEICDLQVRLKNAHADRDEYRTKFDHVKKDMVLMKVSIDQ